MVWTRAGWDWEWSSKLRFCQPLELKREKLNPREASRSRIINIIGGNRMSLNRNWYTITNRIHNIKEILLTDMDDHFQSSTHELDCGGGLGLLGCERLMLD